MGFDPMTHRPRTDIFSSLSNLIALANLIDTSQYSWEEQALRLQAEMTKLQYIQSLLQPPPPPSDFDPSIPFTHMPDLLQVSTNPPLSSLTHDNNESSPWNIEGSTPSPPSSIVPHQPTPPPPTTTTTTTLDGDDDDNSIWPQLLQDPLFNEIA